MPRCYNDKFWAYTCTRENELKTRWRTIAMLPVYIALIRLTCYQCFVVTVSIIRYHFLKMRVVCLWIRSLNDNSKIDCQFGYDSRKWQFTFDYVLLAVTCTRLWPLTGYQYDAYRSLKTHQQWHGSVDHVRLFVSFLQCSDLQCESKSATIVLSITSRNDGRFSKFFHC